MVGLDKNPGDQPILIYDVKKPAVEYDLADGYSDDSITDSLDKPLYCGTPVYGLEVYNDLGTKLDQTKYSSFI